MLDAQRGDVFDADLGPLGTRPVVIVTRAQAIPVLNRLTVVIVTSTIRNHPAEALLDEAEGLDHECVANRDDVVAVPKGRFARFAVCGVRRIGYKCPGEGLPDAAGRAHAVRVRIGSCHRLRPAAAAALRPSRSLPDGLRVPAGARLVAPTFVLEQQGGRPTSWNALMTVTGNPRAVWARVATTVTRRAPGHDIHPTQAPGCVRRDRGLECRLAAPSAGGTILSASLLDPPDNHTGRYVLTLGSSANKLPQGLPERTFRAADGPAGPFPRPRRRQPVRRTRDLLAGDTDQLDQRVLPGSSVVLHYGYGSETGGFDVLLRIHPGADPDALGKAYARRAAEDKGRTIVRRRPVGADRITTLQPPGGGGDYQGVITVIDRPGAQRDYLTVSFSND